MDAALSRDTDCLYTEDWSVQVKQENLTVVKQEPEDVCCTGYITLHWSYLEWPKVQILLNHYYTRCAELETENS